MAKSRGDAYAAAVQPGTDLSLDQAVAYALGEQAPADQAVWARVARSARCADGVLDPDEWFPVSEPARVARQEAAAAIAVCAACPVRGECLALSLRHWDIGRHGVWGGLVAADRARLRARSRAGRTGGRRIAVVRDAGAAGMPGRSDGW
jgi:hypothetical protein